MKLEKYVKILKSVKILENIFTNYKTSENHIIWQKDTQKSRLIFIILDLKINPKNNLLLVKIDLEEISNFKLGLSTYFKFDNKYIFKTHATEIIKIKNAYWIMFTSPKEIKIAEKRQNPRFYLENQTKVYIKIIFTLKDNSKFTSFCLLKDYSFSGLCVSLTKETISNINFSETLIIYDANQVIPHIKGSIRGKIRNIRISTKNTIYSDELYSIGIELEF